MAEERTIALTPGAIIRYSLNSDGCLIIHYKEGNEKQLAEYFNLISKLIYPIFMMNNDGVDNHGKRQDDHAEARPERNEQGSRKRDER